MSRLYEMHVEIADLHPSREEAVKKAATLVWPFEDWLPWDDKLIASVEGSLCGGESEEEFAKRLTHAIWKTNEKYCPVEVRATYLEEMPRETYIFDEDDHDECLKAGDQSVQTQENSNHGGAQGEPEIQ